jgi:hypothetical protein
VPSEKLINAIASEVLHAELLPLGTFMDKVETRRTKSTPESRASRFQMAAQRARRLIEQGVDLPAVRETCLKSPSLVALLEAVLFDRAAARGRLGLNIDWSRYGR